jgi:hypothetical protein
MELLGLKVKEGRTWQEGNHWSVPSANRLNPKGGDGGLWETTEPYG